MFESSAPLNTSVTCSALECARIQNSIAHLERTNDELRSFLAEEADAELSLALEENAIIM